MANTNHKKWSRAEVVRVFEIVLEKGSNLFASQGFRKHLNRDENLIANQVTREANGNIAYRSVDFKINEEMSDEAFWLRIEQTPYKDMIVENATVGLLKMAEKLKLVK